MSSPRRYFDEVHSRGARFLDELPVHAGDLQHHAPGCYSAHSGIKAWQRRAQWAVLSAERWAAVVALRNGVPYPRGDLERAWKQILFNQFHDILPGSAIESAYDDARDELGEAMAIAKRITTLAHNVVARQVNVPFEDGTQPVLVFNPHSWDVETDVGIQYSTDQRGAHVVDHEGLGVLSQATQPTATTPDDMRRAALTFRARVPALGYALYRLRPGSGERLNSGPLQVSDTLLENAHVRITVDPVTGWISSWLDKVSGVDLMVGQDAASHTQICQDPTDTWGHRVVSYAWPGASMRTGRVTAVENGPLRAMVRIERTWGRSTLVEELFLDHDSPNLRIGVTLDWREQGHLLKLRFPTSLRDTIATYEVPFGAIERPVDGAEEPAQSWVALSGRVGDRPVGLAVLATNKHGYDVSPGGRSPDDGPGGAGASVGVTAVRSPVYAWHDPQLLDPDGYYSYQDQGRQQFTLELVPFEGPVDAGRLTRQAALLQAPLHAMQESSHSGELPGKSSFVREDAVLITAIKGSEDPVDSPGGADLIIRAVETSGRAVTARLQLPLLDSVITETFAPHQIRTFRITQSGAMTEVDLLEWPVGQPI